jgi:hypothetical protein
VEDEIYEKLEKHLGAKFVTEEGQQTQKTLSSSAAVTVGLLSAPNAWRQESHNAATNLLGGFEDEKILAALDR